MTMPVLRSTAPTRRFVPPTSIFDGQTYNDIWYDYFATCTGDLTVTTCEELGGSAEYDSDIVVYDGCDICLAGNDVLDAESDRQHIDKRDSATPKAMLDLLSGLYQGKFLKGVKPGILRRECRLAAAVPGGHFGIDQGDGRARTTGGHRLEEGANQVT